MAYYSPLRVAWIWKAGVANRLRTEQELQLVQCCTTIGSFKLPLVCWQGTGERGST